MSNDDFISNFYNSPSSPEQPKAAPEKKDTPPVKKSVKKKEIFSDRSVQGAKIHTETPTSIESIKNTEIKSFDEYFKELTAYHDEIHQTLQEIYAKIGQSPESIQTYLDNPQNFTDQQYLMIQQRREELQKDLLSKLTKEVRDSIQLQTQKERTKKRKNKTIGARKRWLTMD